TLDGAEDLGDRLFVRLLECRDDFFPGEGRNVVLQLGELLRNVLGDEVGTHRQQLAELYEHRAQRLDGQAQALAAWARRVAMEVGDAEEPAQRPAAPRRNEFVQAEP